jgi:hypothetical protein
MQEKFVPSLVEIGQMVVRKFEKFVNQQTMCDQKSSLRFSYQVSKNHDKLFNKIYNKLFQDVKIDHHS